MANRRMISKDIYLDDKFTDLSVKARMLYTYCDLLADDDGFISSVKQALFFSNAETDDLQSLIDANFIIKFESGVYCLKHWRLMNEIRKDRYAPTIHIEEFAMLKPISDKNKTYEIICTQNGNNMDTICIQNGNNMDTQDSIGQVQGSLGKDSTVKGSTGKGNTGKESLEKVDDTDTNNDEFYETVQFFMKKRNKEVKESFTEKVGKITKLEDWKTLKELTEMYGAGFVIMCIEKVADFGGKSMEYLRKTCNTVNCDEGN